MLRHLQQWGHHVGHQTSYSMRNDTSRKCVRESRHEPHLSADVPPSWLVHTGSLQNQTDKAERCHMSYRCGRDLQLQIHPEMVKCPINKCVHTCRRAVREKAREEALCSWDLQIFPSTGIRNHRRSRRLRGSQRLLDLQQPPRLANGNHSTQLVKLMEALRCGK